MQRQVLPPNSAQIRFSKTPLGTEVWLPCEGLEVIREYLVEADIPRRYTEDYVLGVWFSRSARWVKYRRTWQPVPPGTLITVQAGEVVQGRSPEPFTAYKLVVKSKLWQRLLEEAGEPSQAPYFPKLYLEDPRLVRRFVRLHRRLSRLQRPDLEPLRDLLCDLSRGYAESWPAARERTAIKRAKVYLREHCCEEVTLEDVADYAHLNKYDLLKAFRLEVGITPHAYLICLRLERAKELLHRGFPIAQAASESGFSDQSHLTRLLKRYWHLTPGQYRPLERRA